MRVCLYLNTIHLFYLTSFTRVKGSNDSIEVYLEAPVGAGGSSIERISETHSRNHIHMTDQLESYKKIFRNNR